MNLGDSNFIAGLLASVGGGIIAGIFALLSVVITHRYNLKRQEKEETNEVLNLQRALYDELLAYKEQYFESIGVIINNSDDSVDRFLPQKAPFTIYDQCATSIGKIGSEELRRLIVKTFSALSIYSDLINWHNVALKNYEVIYWGANTLDEKEKLEAAEDVLKVSSHSLRKNHKELSNQINELISSFDCELRRNTH